ncbi:hypothetical protein B0T22DRAFT_4418 [Podospora appendiculata]|uniref:Uncharacterized protein n=1 Tax=Podospora appendiculata TaxID=314037 RepID=A0AAE0XF15_9PEZI|nr:hypothetical protein B0T22DRAFT_4418 [Podospora appendiculata]
MVWTYFSTFISALVDKQIWAWVCPQQLQPRWTRTDRGLEKILNSAFAKYSCWSEHRHLDLTNCSIPLKTFLRKHFPNFFPFPPRPKRKSKRATISIKSAQERTRQHYLSSLLIPFTWV